ncbi:hypothetical protein WOLCODRAFT_139917 [Wolfiporia cocos MD-104 SS10]|uniref:Pinin/SDK/MemA protein domain-containing protein n=1 Tax=Wolfiporia cocos (strain MD-104) TaxID=742152 RepID=A0A2H3IZV0_WOLCO|nr:hypothetical protein WOLCODRAFT_139917 [Wolfiporia cocos MD-104 SS10]
MATESPQPQTQPQPTDADTPMADSVLQPQAGRKRPRIEMSDAGQRKRGKSMFGLVIGTLTKAKNEDRERNSSEAAKKRQLIEQRLQEKLRRETDSVRRAEEAKKDKTTANRKEEELQLQDSIYKLRRTRLPLLANFLLTSDVIPDLPSSDSPDAPFSSTEGENDPARVQRVLVGPPRAHPPPLYYLPARLTPAQEAFLNKRREEVRSAAETEWASFSAERATGLAEIARLRSRVAEEEARVKGAGKSEDVDILDADADAPTSTREGADKTEERDHNHDVHIDRPATEEAEASAHTNGAAQGQEQEHSQTGEVQMDVDDSGALSQERGPEQEQSLSTEQSGPPVHAPVQADDDDAVEY